jgi:hypothetical protein
MNWLRKTLRRKDVVLAVSELASQLSKSGAVLPSASFDCAPGEGNYLQSECTGHPAGLIACCELAAHLKDSSRWFSIF